MAASAAAAILYALIAGGDYLDGLVARATGQYSRMGAILDPIVDRVTILSGVIVCWHFELLPRWALAALIARELVTVLAAEIGLRRGMDVEVNWLGRIGVWAGHERSDLAVARTTRGCRRRCCWSGFAALILATASCAPWSRAEARHADPARDPRTEVAKRRGRPEQPACAQPSNLPTRRAQQVRPGGGGHVPGHRRGAIEMALHCPECGFVNPEGANYCRSAAPISHARRARRSRRR